MKEKCPICLASLKLEYSNGRLYICSKFDSVMTSHYDTGSSMINENFYYDFNHDYKCLAFNNEEFSIYIGSPSKNTTDRRSQKTIQLNQESFNQIKSQINSIDNLKKVIEKLELLI